MIAHKPSKWWPLGFLITWIVLAVIGGGLYGGAVAQALNNMNNCSTITDANGNSSNVCTSSSGGGGMYWAGIAFIALAGITHFIFWIVLIVWLVKRHNYHKYANPATQYTTQPSTVSPQYHQDKMPVNSNVHPV